MQEEITWEAFEYEYKPKSTNWFWVIWILALGIFFTAYTFSNILFGIFVLVGVFSISIFASRKPNLIKVTLTDEEIIIYNKKYNFETLESFWIENNKILLKSKRKTAPFIIIPLNPQVDIEEIKEYLLERLEEEKLQESFFQILLEKIW
jgi:hypothetical protein